MNYKTRCFSLLSAVVMTATLAILPATGQAPHYPLNQPKPKAPAAEIDSAEIDPEQRGDLGLQAALDTVLQRIGSGYNSFTKKTAGDCVTGTVYGPKPTSFAPSYSVRVIQSYEQFASEMTVEASLGADVGGFSGKVHSKFTQSGSSNTTKQYLLVRERVVAAPDINLRNAKLTVPLPVAGDANSERGFYMRCGDEYISQIQMGGEFLAFLSFTKSEEDLKQELGIDASGSGWGVTASASFNSKISSLANRSDLQIEAVQVGGKTESLPELDLQSMIAYTRAFPAQITAETVAPIGLGTPQPYTFLGVDEKDLSENQQNFETANTAMTVAATRIDQARDVLALLSHYAVPSKRAKGDVIERTQQQLAQAQADYQTLNRALKACATYFWQDKSCTFDPRFLSYRPAEPGPIEIRSINITEPHSPTTIPLKVNSTLELRGQYCWRGNNVCDADGKWSGDGVAWVQVDTGTFSGRYDGQPVAAPKGNATVQAIDAEDGYGDNKGDLWVIAY